MSNKVLIRIDVWIDVKDSVFVWVWIDLWNKIYEIKCLHLVCWVEYSTHCMLNNIPQRTFLDEIAQGKSL